MPTLLHSFVKAGGFRRRLRWVLAGWLAGLSLAAGAQPATNAMPDSSSFRLIPRDSGDWTRHFHVGVLIGMNISARFNENGLFNVSGNQAALGIYDDGYVREDQTGNAGGYTSYWGYNNASQYNAANQTLTMHSASTYSSAGSATVDGGPAAGFDLAYGDNYWYWKNVRVGWELGFGLLPISITDNHPLSATVNQSSYTYDTGGIVVPSAGSAGYFGGPSGQGPLLPGQRTPPVTQTFSSGTVTGTRTLDVTLYTVRLGPSLFWDLSDNFGLSVSAGPAIGIASGNYNFNEVITTGTGSTRNNGSFGATDVVYGGYVNATLKYHIVDNGRNAYFYVGAEYMPLGSATFSSGGREGQLNLDGQLYLSAGLGWPF